MKFGAALGWGIGIYAVMGFAWSLIAVYGYGGMLLSRFAELLVLVVVATIAARSLRFHSWKDILPYSVLWATIAASLDAALNVPSIGWQLFYDWNIWLGYTLLVVVPLFAPYTRPLPGTPVS